MKERVVKRPRGRPVTTGKGEQVVVRILPDLMAALDTQVAATSAESRASAIRKILTDYFKRKGIL